MLAPPGGTLRGQGALAGGEPPSGQLLYGRRSRGVTGDSSLSPLMQGEVGRELGECGGTYSQSEMTTVWLVLVSSELSLEGFIESKTELGQLK